MKRRGPSLRPLKLGWGGQGQWQKGYWASPEVTPPPTLPEPSEGAWSSHKDDMQGTTPRATLPFSPGRPAAHRRRPWEPRKTSRGARWSPWACFKSLNSGVACHATKANRYAGSSSKTSDTVSLRIRKRRCRIRRCGSSTNIPRTNFNVCSSPAVAQSEPPGAR